MTEPKHRRRSEAKASVMHKASDAAKCSHFAISEPKRRRRSEAKASVIFSFLLIKELSPVIDGAILISQREIYFLG
jgi:hypothetical protein